MGLSELRLAVSARALWISALGQIPRDCQKCRHLSCKSFLNHAPIPGASHNRVAKEYHTNLREYAEYQNTTPMLARLHRALRIGGVAIDADAGAPASGLDDKGG